MKNEEMTLQGANNERELTLDDLTGQFIRNPKVGETIVLDIDKIIVNEDTEKVNKNTGKKFSTSLSGGVGFNWKILTKDGKTYECSVWEVVGKIKQIIKELNLPPKTAISDYTKKNKLVIKVAHVKDGQQSKSRGDNYEVTLVK